MTSDFFFQEESLAEETEGEGRGKGSQLDAKRKTGGDRVCPVPTVIGEETISTTT